MEDLKIGRVDIDNLLLDQYQRIIVVESINSAGINLVAGDGPSIYETYNWSELKGILLSEEWLLKLGFERVSKGKEFVWIHKSYYMFSADFWHLRFKGEGCVSLSSGKEYLRNLKYVHQLQNLFFDLTDQKLEMI